MLTWRKFALLVVGLTVSFGAVASALAAPSVAGASHVVSAVANRPTSGIQLERSVGSSRRSVMYHHGTGTITYTQVSACPKCAPLRTSGTVALNPNTSGQGAFATLSLGLLTMNLHGPNGTDLTISQMKPGATVVQFGESGAQIYKSVSRHAWLSPEFEIGTVVPGTTAGGYPIGIIAGGPNPTASASGELNGGSGSCTVKIAATAAQSSGSVSCSNLVSQGAAESPAGSYVYAMTATFRVSR